MTSFPIPKCCANGGVPPSDICIPLDLRAHSVVIPAPPPRSPLLSSSALHDSVNFDEWVDLQSLVEEEGEEDGDSNVDMDMDIATPSTADERNNADSGQRDDGEDGGAPSTPPDTTTAADTNVNTTPTPAQASPISPSPSPSATAWHTHHPILELENLDLLGVRQRQRQDRVRFDIDHYDRLARDDAERPTHVDPKAVLWAYKPPTPYVAGQGGVDALVERERQRAKRRSLLSSLAAAPMLGGPGVQDVFVGRGGMRGGMRVEDDMEDDAEHLRSEEQQQEWVESERERERRQRHLHTIQARTNETAFQERLKQQQQQQAHQQKQQEQRENQQRMDEQRQQQQMQTPPRQQQGAFLHRRQRSDQSWATPQQTTPHHHHHHHHRRQRSDQSWATPQQHATPQMVNNQQCTPHRHRRQRSDQSWATPRQRLSLNDEDDDEIDKKAGEETMRRQKAMRPVLVYERSTSRCAWRPRSLVVDSAPKAMHAIPIPLPTTSSSSHSTSISATLTPLFTPTPHIPTILLYIPLSPTHAHTYDSTGGFKSCARCTTAGLRELRRVAALVRGELVPEDLGWVCWHGAGEAVLREVWCLEPPVVGELGEGEGEGERAEGHAKGQV